MTASYAIDLREMSSDVGLFSLSVSPGMPSLFEMFDPVKSTYNLTVPFEYPHVVVETRPRCPHALLSIGSKHGGIHSTCISNCSAAWGAACAGLWPCTVPLQKVQVDFPSSLVTNYTEVHITTTAEDRRFTRIYTVGLTRVTFSSHLEREFMHHDANGDGSLVRS